MNIESHQIGSGHPAFLIAELSANHDRDLEQALALVDIAADAGWQSVKLQTYSADSLTMRSDHPSMKVDPVWGAETLYDLYEAAAMPMAFHAPLFARARERGLVPFTSVYDPRDLDFLEGLGCPLYKIASFEMTYDDLLKAVAKTGKPIIVSSGMADAGEVRHAVDVLQTAGAREVVLLHCCSSYPAPMEETNLAAMRQMATDYELPVGFSDHTIGSIGPLAAIAMGAVAVEKHFTNDPDRGGPDHRFSATPDVMKEIAEGAAAIHAARGDGIKRTLPAEETNKALGRRSAFALRDLHKGHVLRHEDYRFIRPAAGWPADRADALPGRVLTSDIPAGYPIRVEDVRSG